MKIALPEQRKLVHDMVLSIRWGDMDAMGHVNNTVYFRYMETVRIEWMRAVGCDPDPQGQGPVIVNAFCNFYRQLEYPGDVRVKLYVSDPGRTTFETWCTMERTDQPGVVMRRRRGHHHLGGLSAAKSRDPARLDAGTGDPVI
jgi:acyl-CoA thioester hydrolase